MEFDAAGCFDFHVYCDSEFCFEIVWNGLYNYSAVVIWLGYDYSMAALTGNLLMEQTMKI